MKIRRIAAVLALALASFACIPSHAQTPTVVAITFDGHNDSTASIITEDGVTLEWPGTMSLTYSYGCGPGFGILLENVNGPRLPNNGDMCGFYNQLSYGQVEWGTRSDGSTMNGTEAGDYFIHLAHTMIPVENNDPSYWGNVPYVPVYVNLNLTMTYNPTRVCLHGGRGGCFQWGTKLQPFFTGGNGTLQFTVGR